MKPMMNELKCNNTECRKCSKGVCLALVKRVTLSGGGESIYPDNPTPDECPFFKTDEDYNRLERVAFRRKRNGREKNVRQEHH